MPAGLFDPDAVEGVPRQVEVVRLLVAYDGTDFRGFAPQAGVPTVGGVLAEAIEKVVGAPVQLTCAGRTDAGVHAWGQVVTTAVPAGTDLERLDKALNGMLAPRIVIRETTLAGPGFDARRSAGWRRYRYTILNRTRPDPFLVPFAWWVRERLDMPALRLGADPFIGEHDFASFCRRGPAGSSTVRTVLESHWTDLGDGVLRYEIRARAFCWQMVRSIVGTLVDVGRGKRRPGEISEMLRARDRAVTGDLAPPHGLCLWEVGF